MWGIYRVCDQGRSQVKKPGTYQLGQNSQIGGSPRPCQQLTRKRHIRRQTALKFEPWNEKFAPISYRSGKKSGRMRVPDRGRAPLVSTLGRGLAIGADELLRQRNLLGGEPRKAIPPLAGSHLRQIDDLRAPAWQRNQPVLHVLLPDRRPRFRCLHRFRFARGSGSRELTLLRHTRNRQRPTRNSSLSRSPRSSSSADSLLIHPRV